MDGLLEDGCSEVWMGECLRHHIWKRRHADTDTSVSLKSNTTEIHCGTGGSESCRGAEMARLNSAILPL